jgi:uncharacterized membrane protein
MNILIGFNIDYFYIRAIFAFLSIMIIPGLLIILIFKLRKIEFWEYLVYTIGLSISFIMFAGLLVNWILPLLHITNKPLQLIYILPIFDMILFIFWIVAYFRNKDLKEINFNIPTLDWINNLFFIIPMLFPVLSILGALMLNNYGTSILIMIALFGIEIYVLLIIIFRKRLNPKIYPWAIWMISIALLAMFDLRSFNPAGIDINIENFLYRLTKEKLIWDISNFKDAYNACLSITLLPWILDLFVNINSFLLMKIMSLFIFSFLPLIMFLIFKKYFNNSISFFGAFFFVSQPIFMEGASIPIRQRVSLLFFALVLLALVLKKVSTKKIGILTIIFSFSMIVSHYSTSYLGILIFLLIFLLSNIYNLLHKKGPGKIIFDERFSITIFLIIFAFTFLWYSQLTGTSSGLIQFVGKSIENAGDIFSGEVQAQDKSLISQLNPFQKEGNFTKLVESYKAENIAMVPSSQMGYLNLRYPQGIPPRVSIKIHNFYSLVIKNIQQE